jgi:hypothetical protein
MWMLFLNIKIKNSKMSRFQWKWIFTGSKTCCTIWRPFWFAMVAILNQKSTHYGGYSYKVSWSLMKGIQNFLKFPLFCFHGNCGKVCPTDSNFFGLSRSTICGTQSGDVLLFYVSFSLLLLFLFFHTFLSARFLGDALIKLYETL